MEPACLHDRVCLPDDQGGHDAYVELMGRETKHRVLSERSARAAQTRCRRKALGWYKPESEIPF